MAAYWSGPEYDSDEDEEEVKDCFLKEEFQRLTDLIQGNTCPGDFSCSGWFWFSVGRFFFNCNKCKLLAQYNIQGF